MRGAQLFGETTRRVQKASDVSMRRIREWRDASHDVRGAVTALGNFDGVHRGHLAVLDAARAVAHRLDAPLAVMVFAPHPRRFFNPAAPSFRLMSDEVRARTLAEAGVDILYETPFDRDLSLMDASTFVHEVLVSHLGVRGVAAGFDYRFGKDRSGDVTALGAIAKENGFELAVADPLTVGETKCSSSAIRAALREGDMAGAEAMLTRPWVIDGVVARGDQRGRVLGFPTANVSLGDLVRPRFGVYAVELQVEGEAMWRPGVANIGKRPTVGGTEERLEAHVFDFQGDLYGRRVEVRPRAFVRDERAFDGLDALKAQIADDARQARMVLGAE